MKIPLFFNPKPFLVLLVMGTVGVTAASAAVTIQSSFDNNVQVLAPTNDGNGNFSYTFTAASLTGFDATAGSKLVFGYTSRYEADSQSGALPTSITFGGAALSPTLSGNQNRATTGIWYLDNVAANGDLVINFGTNGLTDMVGFSLFALDGLAVGGPTSVGQGTTAPTVVLGSNGGFILHTAGRNNQSLSVNAGYTLDYDFSSGGAQLLTQHRVSETGGSFAPNANNTNTMNHTTAAWNAIPEPSAALLGGLGLLALLRRRR